MHPWPFYDLRVVHPRLVLRLPTEDEVVRLASAAVGRLAEGSNPEFLDDASSWPSPAFERHLLQQHWITLGAAVADRWQLRAVAFSPLGEPLGMGILAAEDFRARRSVLTTSWLLPHARGQGLGTLLRQMMLQLAFGLGAVEACSGAHPDNAASNAISRSLGYEPNGRSMRTRAGRGVLFHSWRIEADWFEPDPDARLEGISRPRAFLGLD